MCRNFHGETHRFHFGFFPTFFSTFMGVLWFKLHHFRCRNLNFGDPLGFRFYGLLVFAETFFFILVVIYESPFLPIFLQLSFHIEAVLELKWCLRKWSQYTRKFVATMFKPHGIHIFWVSEDSEIKMNVDLLKWTWNNFIVVSWKCRVHENNHTYWRKQAYWLIGFGHEGFDRWIFCILCSFSLWWM